MRFLDTLLNLLFPPKCPFCGRVLDRPGVCPACEAALPWLAEEDGLWTLPADVPCAAPLRYEGLARKGLLRFKFQGASAAAEPLGELVARCAAERFAGEFDVVTWVPVSRKRLRQRGYDQAELLARAACRLWNTRPVRLLDKRRDNPAQSGLHDAVLRRENVRDVYAASGAAAGRRILLVDDICTTGATLSSCALALRQAGAETVLCCTAARAVMEKVHKSGEE
ncbi:MAG: ComF family protein [Oscillibacter sp.]|nr:ComF family protein [Oscillibacter sp.]